jgi:AAA15 family ATPase/GTPase
MIKHLELKNFTVFRDLALDFSPKINVIIGENGTGKTHILKAAYGLCAGDPLYKNNPDISSDDLKEKLTAKLLRLFMPMDEKIGKITSRERGEQTSMLATFGQDEKIEATFFKNSKLIDIQDETNYKKNLSEAVFIPTKEVLSFMKGFNSLYDKYELSFDQTYQDICLLLDLPEVRSDKLHEKSKWAMEEIEKICGGRFIFYGGGKVTFKTDTSEYSANAMAEGFRKAGMLSRLLETGAIQPGVSGSLFWDEPESNMNPKLMKQLVEILLELSRNGQQVVLTTHDYVLLKWFDLLMDIDKGDHVIFHSLYRDEERDIKINSVEDYRQISENAIADSFNDLTKEQVSKKMGALGK